MSAEFETVRLTGEGWPDYFNIPEHELQPCIVTARKNLNFWDCYAKVNGVVVGCIYKDGIYSGEIVSAVVDDNVNHPAHYTSDPSGVECIEITRHRSFNIGNAIKYLWRAGLKKSGSLSDNEKEIEDLQKAIFYIKDEIALLRGEA